MMMGPGRGCGIVLWLALALLGACRSKSAPTGLPDGAAADATTDRAPTDQSAAGADRVTSPADGPVDAPADGPPADTVADSGAADTGSAGVACGTMTCGAGEICVITSVAGGIPGSGVTTSHACRPRPGSCPAELDCTCTRSYCLFPACACRLPPMTSATIQCDCAAP